MKIYETLATDVLFLLLKIVFKKRYLVLANSVINLNLYPIEFHMKKYIISRRIRNLFIVNLRFLKMPS